MILRQARDIAEGVVYGALFRGAPERRRKRLGKEGLRPLRETWWTPLQYESNRALWSNLYLLESSREPRRTEAVFPAEARVVVYTPGHIGDVLHAVPLLRALREARPCMELVWVVGPWCERLARRYAEPDRVEVFSPAWHQYRRGTSGPTLRSQKRWGSAKSAADVFISTARTDLTALFVGRSVQPGWWIGRPPLSRLYPVAAREDIVPVREDVYEAEDLLELGSPLWIQSKNAVLAYGITEDERRQAEARLRDAGVDPQQPYVVIAPCAGWAGKQWPLERWSVVADKLHEHGLNVVLAGTAGERKQCLRVAAAMKKTPVNMAGQTNLEEMAAMNAGSRLWLGSDSGGLHLAAAVGTPTVSLFGPTNPDKWAPRGPRHRFLRAVDGCPGCVPWHPRARCRHRADCMIKIETGAVMEEALHLLGSS